MTEQLDRAPRPVDTEGMDRSVGLLGLLWASESSIIGSGWLFGALTAVTIAGPAALISWCIASIIIAFLALVHAELGPMFPVSGGTSRFPHYAFGSLAGETFGWFAYIQGATVVAIEVLAAIQYMSTASWAHGFYNASTNTLSGSGIMVAIGLMIVFVFINSIGVRWLTRMNTPLTSWKVLTPVMTIVILVLFHMHIGNFTAGGGFFPHSAPVKRILLALPAGGVVFALLGFEQAVQMGGESRNPSRDLPRAVIGSLLVGAVIYILVQVAFIGALSPKLLSSAGGWLNLDASGNNSLLTQLQAGPFYTVAKIAGIGWLAWVLRVDAVLSPGGTGLIYLTSTSRIGFGMSRNGYFPRIFERNNAVTKVPVVGIVISGIIGLVFLLPFPSWSQLVTVTTSATVMMYAGAPLALGALRLQKPDLPRPYRLPHAKVVAPLAFVLANYIIYWAGWGTYSALMVVLLIGYGLMGLSAKLKLNPNQPQVDWGASVWLLPWLVGLGIISYLGPFGSSDGGPSGIIGGVGMFKHVLVGGNGTLPLYWDLVLLAAFGLGIYFLAIHKRLSRAQVDAYIADVYPLPAVE